MGFITPEKIREERFSPNRFVRVRIGVHPLCDPGTPSLDDERNNERDDKSDDESGDKVNKLVEYTH